MGVGWRQQERTGVGSTAAPPRRDVSEPGAGGPSRAGSGDGLCHLVPPRVAGIFTGFLLRGVGEFGRERAGLAHVVWGGRGSAPELFGRSVPRKDFWTGDDGIVGGLWPCLGRTHGRLGGSRV